ncbi:MAG: phosphomannomutase/phosphoglucomutase [Kiritimatiellae bacterium]|nr:phosphomannomutase/phosphoglucomutase [Kiritimatiellia bacterium]
MGIFKAYDIRGVYRDGLDEDLAYRIGRRLPALLGGKRALVGRDARLSSPSLTEALLRGISDAGCDVDDMGLASTPMVYYFTAEKGYDFSVQVTASHNPPEYNGLKISRAGARPVGYDSGLAELEKAVAEPLPPPASAKGRVEKVDYIAEFVDFLRPWVPDLSGVRLVVDCSDGMASLIVRELFGGAAASPNSSRRSCGGRAAEVGPLHGEAGAAKPPKLGGAAGVGSAKPPRLGADARGWTKYVAATPDGSFPNHAPNPFEPAGRTLICKTVRESKADAGVIYDGDADRMMLIDENGDFVRPDLMIGVMAMPFLRKYPGATILQDIRTSRGVTEFLREAGAKTAMWKVGHAFAKVKMRELNAVFGGELAGHYYFRDFHWCDSGELASLVALGEIAAAQRRGVRLSELVKPIDRYANTGELNFRIGDKAGTMERLRKHFVSKAEPVALYDFDGYRIEYRDWWFNVRPSNTEPYLRLIVEAKTPEMLAERREEIEKVLGRGV